MKNIHIILNWKRVGKAIFGYGTKRDTIVILSLVDKRDCHLGKGCYQYPVSHGVGVFLSHWPCHVVKVVELLTKMTFSSLSVRALLVPETKI